MFHILGTITPTTHIHQSDPNRQGNRTPTMTTYAWGPDRVRRQIPFVTANSIRGLLRRAAATVYLDALGEPVTRETFHVLTTGKAGRHAIGDQPSPQALTQGVRHPFAGLFGGGSYMLPSRYTMAPLMPVIEWCANLLHPSLRDDMIPAERLRYPVDEGQWRDIRLTTDLIQAPRDDVLAGHGADYIKDYQASLEAWINEVTAGRTAKASGKAKAEEARKRGERPAADDAGKGADVQNFVLTEAILPGTPLQFSLRLKAASTPAQIGLMLLAVRDWANRNQLGGGSARGFGRFEAQLALLDGDSVVAPSLFRLDGHATAYELGEEAKPFVQAARDELAVATLDDLLTAYPLMPGG